MTKVVLINGPNLNTLGQRQPEIYGNTSLGEIEKELTHFFTTHGMQLICFQSNHEGALIDFLQQHQDASGIIVNLGGLTHTSVALHDALIAFSIPFFEVHISNIYNRENFRKNSLISGYAKGVVVGFGIMGYHLAALGLVDFIQNQTVR